jgi:hypothetical protein
MEHGEAVVTAAEHELDEVLLDEALANAIRQLIAGALPRRSSPAGAQAGS